MIIRPLKDAVYMYEIEWDITAVFAVFAGSDSYSEWKCSSPASKGGIRPASVHVMFASV